MMNRRIVLAMVACALLSSTPAFAGGGGGTKKDSTITVRNDTGGPIAAFIDPDQVKINALPAAPTKAQIEAAGGQLINSKAKATFKVSQGTYQLAAGTNPATPATASVTIGKGKTINYAFTPAGALVKY